MLGNCPVGFLWRGRGGGKETGGVLLNILSWSFVALYFILEFCCFVFFMRDVLVPGGGDGGLDGGEGMCYTWSRARWSHWVFRGHLVRVPNYTPGSIVLHKIYMAVCKSPQKHHFRMQHLWGQQIHLPKYNWLGSLYQPRSWAEYTNRTGNNFRIQRK